MRQSTKTMFSNYARRSFLVCATSIFMLTGCATHYVDTALKDVPAEKLKKVAEPKPVQLLFEFQTKSGSNPVATNQLKSQVTDIVKSTGLFSDVSPTPVANGTVLSIVVNNVVMTDDAASQGFVTGLTFGLAGSSVTDGYVCTVVYIADSNTPKISKVVRHAIHTTLGNAKVPANAGKPVSMDEAVTTMLRQIVTNGVNDIATDATFK
ncbi:MAG: hypothetical protein Q7T66_01640 [Herminiimonas sp.]|uniref:hypothetical protein n=1 Tax=Herminiimonas sp. TaxID=1926289 RepID=UPI002728EC29|nr:hypothetical protein [Herminiimonas sp.]MDO9419342.1 hypothetical protein [Herminiimonas sp.]